MSVTIHCPRCDEQYVVGPELLGVTVRCTVCGHEFTATRPIEPETILAEVVEEPAATPADAACMGTAEVPSEIVPPLGKRFPSEAPPRGWGATHKLLVGAVASAGLAVVIGVLMGHYVMAGCLAATCALIIPSGLRAYPGWRQSRSWIPFLAVAVPVLLAGVVLVYYFWAKQHFPSPEIARVALASLAVLCFTETISGRVLTGNTEARRPRRKPAFSRSVLSVPPCFKVCRVRPRRTKNWLRSLGASRTHPTSSGTRGESRRYCAAHCPRGSSRLCIP